MTNSISQLINVLGDHTSGAIQQIDDKSGKALWQKRISNTLFKKSGIEYYNALLSVVLAMIAFVAPALLMALASSVAQSAFEKCHQHYYCIVHRGWKMKGMDSQWANYVASLEETSRSGNFILRIKKEIY